MPIHQPTSFWSRLLAHFAFGAVAVVVVAIVIGAVAVRESGGSVSEPRAQNRGGSEIVIGVNDDLVRQAERQPGTTGDDTIQAASGSDPKVKSNEDGVRQAEASLQGASADFPGLPAGQLVTLRAFPWYVVVGPLYP